MTHRSILLRTTGRSGLVLFEAMTEDAYDVMNTTTNTSRIDRQINRQIYRYFIYPEGNLADSSSHKAQDSNSNKGVNNMTGKINIKILSTGIYTNSKIQQSGIRSIT